jgi:hypothetical protein
MRIIFLLDVTSDAVVALFRPLQGQTRPHWLAVADNGSERAAGVGMLCRFGDQVPQSNTVVVQLDGLGMSGRNVGRCGKDQRRSVCSPEMQGRQGG